MQLIAPDKKSKELTAKTENYIRQSVSENSRLAFKSDMSCFYKFGGVIPCDPEMVAGYISFCAGVLSVATIERRLSSISKAHKIKGHLSPTQSELVKMTLRGIQRIHGKPQACASPLLKEDIIAIHGQIKDDPKGLRDRAILLIGFCGAFRRSELVGLNIKDIEFTSQGAVITLRRSKSDQFGVGKKTGVPYGRGRICPVKSLQTWIELLSAESGALFRPINKGGNISETRLSSGAVAELVKYYAAQIGLDPKKYSGHSLRAGLATSAAQHGASSWQIRKQTHHASDAMLARYIRDGDIFRDNAAGILF